MSSSQQVDKKLAQASAPAVVGVPGGPSLQFHAQQQKQPQQQSSIVITPAAPLSVSSSASASTSATAPSASVSATAPSASVSAMASTSASSSSAVAEKEASDKTSLGKRKTSDSSKSTKDLISVNVHRKKTLLAGVTQTLHILFEVHTEADKNRSKRPPVNLAVVLDVSGSMQGDKVKNCKTSIKQIVQELNNSDQLHFVTYQDTAITVFEKGDLNNKALLCAHVDAVSANGGTNIASGLNLGVELTEKYGSAAVASKRMFLFSDGQDNNGVGAHKSLFDLVSSNQKKGINTTTFGIGEGFDEVLMRGLAERGGGDYFYIDKPESIPKLVNDGLEGVLTLIGTNAVFKVRGRDGVVVKKAIGHPTTALVPGIPLGYVKEDDVVQVLFEIEVSPSREGQMDLVSWELSMNPVDATIKEPIVLNGTVGVDVSSAESKTVDEDPKVQVSLGLFKVSETDAKVSEAMAKGDRAKAMSMKKEAIGILESLKDQDKSGMADKALEIARGHVEKIERESVVKVNKALGHAMYQNQHQQMARYK